MIDLISCLIIFFILIVFHVLSKGVFDFNYYNILFIFNITFLITFIVYSCLANLNYIITASLYSKVILLTNVLIFNVFTLILFKHINLFLNNKNFLSTIRLHYVCSNYGNTFFYFLSIFSLLIFSFYLLSNDFHSHNFFHFLAKIRMQVSNGVKPDYFYWFYLAEILPILIFINILFSRNKFSLFSLLIILLLISTLIFTAAKGNIIKPVRTLLFISLFYSYSKKKYFLLFTSIITIVLCYLSLLLYMVYSGDKDNLFDSFLNTLHRFSFQIPTFSLLITNYENHTHGLLLFSPLLKIFNFFDTSIPSHILPFYNIPFSWNVATYNDVGFREFGILGTFMYTVIFSLILFFINILKSFLIVPSVKIFLTFAIPWLSFSSVAIFPIIKPIVIFQLIVFPLVIDFLYRYIIKFK